MSKTELLSRAIDCLEVLDKRDRPMCRDCADMAVDGMCPNSGIACDMGELIAQCRAALTRPAQPAEGGEAREFFAYHSDMGVEFFNGPDAEAAAKSLCDENLKLERAEAISTDEWADDRAESIRWGVVLGRAKFFENPGQEGEDSGDYKMVGYTAPPASQEQMSNGLTEAETSATASVMGLTASQEQAQQPSGETFDQWLKRERPAGCVSDMERGWKACAASQQPSGGEAVAWRTFDGEGGYEYRDFEGNENYADEWAKRNPQHKGWVEPLTLATPKPEQPHA